MRWCWGVSIGLAALFLAVPATAHPVPFSYLDVLLPPASLEVTLTVHIYDLAHDLQVSPMERLLEPAFLEQHEAAIRALLSPRLELTAEGRPIAAEWLGHDIIEERQSVRFHLHYSAPRGPGVLTVSTVMFPYDPNHQT